FRGQIGAPVTAVQWGGRLRRLAVGGARGRHSRAQRDDVAGGASLDPELRHLATQGLPREGRVHVDRRARLPWVVRAELEDVLPGAVLAGERDHRAAQIVPAPVAEPE